MNIRSKKVLLLLTAVVFAFCTAVKAQNGAERLKKADSLYIAKQYGQASVLYAQILRDTSTNSVAWNRLGFSYFNIGDLDKAMNAYQKAIQSNHGNYLVKASVYSRMTRINAIKDKKNDALSNLDSAVTAGYNQYPELDSLKDFSIIRNEARFKELRTKAYNAAYPCMANVQARQFDFWIGEWDAYVTGTKQLAGHSVIQMVSGGCAILENWTSAGSFYSGKSLNFIDPATNKWRQNWIGSGDSQDFVNGEFKEGAMRFTFETKDSKGHKLIGRFIFYKIGPDEVRQFNETSADEGKTWTTAYDFTYLKKK